MKTVWCVFHMHDLKGFCFASVFATREEAMAVVDATPRSGAVEFEVGRDYRDVDQFTIFTATDPDGVVG